VIKQRKPFDLRVLQHATEDPARKRLRCSRIIWTESWATNKQSSNWRPRLLHCTDSSRWFRYVWI